MRLHGHTERMSTLQMANMVGRQVSIHGNQSEQATAPKLDLSKDMTANISVSDACASSSFTWW